MISDFARKITPSGVEYLSNGGSTERVLVFVHGWRDSALGWQWVIDNLKPEEEWRIIAVQRHAVERSNADTAGLLEDYADQVIDAITDGAAPESVIVLVGQSMGAPVAELAASRIAQRLQGLVLLTPAPLAGTPLPPEAREAFEAGARDLDRVNAGLNRVGLAVSVNAETQLRMILATPAESEHSTLQTLASWIGGHPGGQLPSLVTAPTLVLVTDDKAFPEEMLREVVAPRFQNVQIGEVRDAGHFPHLERPEAVARVVEDFVSNL
ncbi:alpha/beta fold hydrolase [Cupriavidus sp. 2TAF22]|uniref:alpha/beta fold hydrolase n=1 Tax=unclassified Cupriavidus TaxID=2640874 RepID=UPI003F932428